MNGGYIMIDFNGFEINSKETQTIPGIETLLNTARKCGKMILCYNLKNGGVSVNAIPSAIDENGNIYFGSFATALNVSGDSVSVVSNGVSMLVNGGAKNYSPVNTATIGAAGNIINGESINLPVGDYIMTFNATSYAPTVSGARVEMTITYTDNTTKKVITNQVVHETNTFAFTATKPVKAYTVYSGGTGNTYSEIMIRPAAFADATYIPYSPTNAELNERVYALEHPTTTNTKKGG